jgi:hypothetical protein
MAIFGALWLSNRQEWWPLIPTCIMAGWGVATLLGNLGASAWLVTLIGMLATSLPFFYIFVKLGAQQGWWALIPGGIIGAWGLASVLGALRLPASLITLVGFVAALCRSS